MINFIGGFKYFEIYIYGDSNWPDKLTSYDGQDIVYDAIGNPLEYRGWEFEWSRGRRLDKAKSSLYNINVAFKYDESGIRTQKIVNGVQTDFVTDGIKVLAQKTGNNTLIWQVDGNGNTVGFNYNGTPYFYMKNLQGDIIGITDTSGNIVAKYTYDSWGKLISIKDANDVDKTTDENFIGYINPLRYRGYYYDTETGLYYLNARYYDPEVGRFISADENIFDKSSLFTYCLNNPVNFVDYDGTIPQALVVLGIGGFIAMVIGAPFLCAFKWDTEQGILYSRHTCVQRLFGYCDLFDKIAFWLDTEEIRFTYDSKDYVIQLWKGYYGLFGTGAEIGIYVEPKGSTILNWRRCANNSEMLTMSFTLEKNKKELFHRGPEKHWWLTGFKPSVWTFKNSLLTMKASITFLTEEMAQAFLEVARNKLGNVELKGSSTVDFIWN